MKFHSFAEVFDLLEGKPFDDLVEDIKSFGLREKIWLYEGKILDGRNRFLACKQAKVDPQYRTFKGGAEGALALVASNDKRRHSTAVQRAFSASKLATLRKGIRPDASQDACTQAEAAAQMGVSRSSLQRAKKVEDKGSKALLKAAKKGEVGLLAAASGAVLQLPKSEQLAAAKSAGKPSVDDDNWEPEKPDMAELDEEADRSYRESLDKIIQSDDRVASMDAELKRQASEIATLKSSRDGYMAGKLEMTRLLKKEQSKTARLERDLKKARDENEQLRERVAIMEAA